MAFYSTKLMQSVLKYDIEGRESDKVKDEDFPEIKARFQASMKSLAAMATTEISKYDDKMDKAEEIKKVDFT